MIDFLNYALEEEKINPLYLQPIHIDTGIVFKHYFEFSKSLLESIEHYYLSKNKYCLGVETGYKYFVRLKQNYKPPVICNLDYNDFFFHIEFSNSETKRALLIGVDETSSHLTLNFYNNFNCDNVKVSGRLVLISNMFNNGISIQLLNIIYEFMENNMFDDEELFKKIDFI